MPHRVYVFVVKHRVFRVCWRWENQSPVHCKHHVRRHKAWWGEWISEFPLCVTLNKFIIRLLIPMLFKALKVLINSFSLGKAAVQLHTSSTILFFTFGGVLSPRYCSLKINGEKTGSQFSFFNFTKSGVSLRQLTSVQTIRNRLVKKWFLVTSFWNRLPQFFIHASSTWIRDIYVKEGFSKFKEKERKKNFFTNVSYRQSLKRLPFLRTGDFSQK